MTLAEAGRIVGPAAKHARAMVKLAEAATVIVKAADTNAGLINQQADLRKSLDQETKRVGKAKAALLADLEQGKTEHAERMAVQQSELDNLVAATRQALVDHNAKMGELGKALAVRVKEQAVQVKQLEREIAERQGKRAGVETQFNDIRNRLESMRSSLG